MFLIRFVVKSLMACVILALFFTFGPISFPDIRIERIADRPAPPELRDGALPIEMIRGTSLPSAAIANSTLIQTDATPAPEPEPEPEQPAAPAFELDAAKVEAVWRDWMVRHKVTKSAMALGSDGTVIHGAGAGRSADTAYPVASLSKAVTAMCLNALLAQSPYSWASPLSDLSAVWTTLDMQPHPELGKRPLSALVTHTSGLPKNIDADETAGEGRNLYTQIHFARSALRGPEHLGSNRKHIYSNVNFALLGQIIEGISDQPYGDACYSHVMAPAGATTAAVGGPMWATAGFGGWTVSASEYARFIMHWYNTDRPWVTDPAAFAYDSKSGAGLGVFHRYTDTRHTLNHTGLWRSKKASRRIGALFVTSTSGAVFVANWQGSLKSNAYVDLRKSITAALH